MMKVVFFSSILLLAGLLHVTNLSGQTFSKVTTNELLKSAEAKGPAFVESNFEFKINFAVPLIDTAVAVERAIFLGRQNVNSFTNAISLQLKNDSLKQVVLCNLLAYDNLCNDEAISTSKYNEVAGRYSYRNFAGAMLYQLEKNDSNILKTAIKEFEFWAPMAAGYMDTIMKSGFQQFAIKSGKRKFSPCFLASPGNCNLWVSCIYYITGKEEYGSANEEFNRVYKKCMKMFRIEKKLDSRKELIRYGKEEILVSDKTIATLDSLEFETIPSLKEKFDNTRKKERNEIMIYTHKNKALLFLSYQDQMMI